MAELKQYKIGDIVKLPTIRPSGWNRRGEMDYLLGKEVVLTNIIQLSDKVQRLYFKEVDRWAVYNWDIPEDNYSLTFKPYQLPVEIKLVPDPPKEWTPKVGELATLVYPVKIFRDFGQEVDVCDDDGNCLKVSKKSLTKPFINQKEERNMKAMKDAVLTVAKTLAKANNTVTTLEIKNELRRDYPYYFWTQDVVSAYMAQLAGDGIFTYKDNGTYRTYSLATGLTVSPNAPTTTGTFSIAPTKKIAKPALPGVLNTRKPKSRTKTITQYEALNYALFSDFKDITISRRAGDITYSKSEIKMQKKSPYGFASVNSGKIKAITVGTKTYNVK